MPWQLRSWLIVSTSATAYGKCASCSRLLHVKQWMWMQHRTHAVAVQVPADHIHQRQWPVAARDGSGPGVGPPRAQAVADDAVRHAAAIVVDRQRAVALQAEADLGRAGRRRACSAGRRTYHLRPQINRRCIFTIVAFIRRATTIPTSRLPLAAGIHSSQGARHSGSNARDYYCCLH